MKGSFQNALVTLNTNGLPQKELGSDVYLLHVLGFSQTYDTRSNPVLPKDGFFAKLNTELGLTLGGGGVSFLRGEGQVSYHKQIFDKSAVVLGARAGVVVPNGSDANLPEAVNGVPQGGEAYWVANAEYIHSFAGPLNGVLVFDAGSLSRDHYALLTGDIKYAVGLGIRLDLPIGPVRFEYGHALNPERNERYGAFHFAIGSAF